MAHESLIECHSLRKYPTSAQLCVVDDSAAMRVETWRHRRGKLPEVFLASTELLVLTKGSTRVQRTGDGRTQTNVGVAGTFWLCPAGVSETNIELFGDEHEAMHFFFPRNLLGQTALESFEVDPSRAQLDYVGGGIDPLVYHIALCLESLHAGAGSSIDRLFLDGVRVTLAAHLLRTYVAQPAVTQGLGRTGVLDPKRLKRVLDYIEENLASEISLERLASEACLSPFHFSRSFLKSTGSPPHQYVLKRRIVRAQEALTKSTSSIDGIALSAGFCSASGFCRAFKKVTGLTPSDFRSTIRGAAVN